jgi:hypothetical protein
MLTMYSKAGLAALVFAGLGAMNSAVAGPQVTVTVKNLSTTTDATYSIIGNNETITNANASPKPKTTLAKGTSDTYVVKSLLGPEVAFATVRYSLGTKYCEFNTSFVLTNGKPQWFKAIPQKSSSGVTCDATITSTDLSTYAWAVEFTIK